MDEKAKGVVAGSGLLLASFIWGFAFVVVKNALDIIPPLYMLAMRFSIAGVVLGAVFWKKLRGLSRTQLKQGVILGVFLFLAYSTQTIGCQYTTAGKNAFLTTLYVVLVPLFQWAVFRKWPGARCLVAAALAFFGIGLLSLNGDMSMNFGDVLTLICGVFYAVHIMFIDQFTKKGDPVQLTILQLLVVAAISWVMAPIFNGTPPAGIFTKDGIIAMAYLGLLSTMVGFTLQNIGQKYTPPAAAALLLSFESVFGALFSAIFLKEHMTSRMLWGCACLFAAVVLSQVKVSQNPKRIRKNAL